MPEWVRDVLGSLFAGLAVGAAALALYQLTALAIRVELLGRFYRTLYFGGE